jgi:exopolysaccharide biosynthesis protein
MASGVLHLSPGIKTGIMTVSHEKLYMDNDWHYYTHMENDQALSNTYGG